MYAISCKFPDQNQFSLMNISKGEQVRNKVYASRFKSKEDAENMVNKIKPIIKEGVLLKVRKL